ncbi:MAG TPA: ATP-binding protein [Candidatus Xenobia bacterium]|jgi:two-component system phosphate regulon sensor histidine kinase PhoR
MKPRITGSTLFSILAGLQDGVLVADSSGSVTYANPSAAHLLECGDIIGHRSTEDASEPLGQVLAALATTTEVRDLIRVPDRDRHLTLHIFDIPNGRVAVLHNVSDYVRVDRMRRKFVANASHELRTPVTALATALEALHLGAKDDPESRDAFLARASREADRLRELAQDLLDLTEAEETSQPTPAGACDAATALGEVFEQFSAAAAARSHGLVYDRPQPLQVAMAGKDLVRALGNVVDNAIKYTPAGSTITLAVRPGGDGVEVTVTDNGPGIEPRYLHRIFERFYRIDKGRSRAVGGTGLGLSITRHLIERIGGSIVAENAPGGGARFRMRLPRAS